jgi:hypothetical protein
MAQLNNLSSVLEHLEIQPQALEDQARFYVSYAQMLERERLAADQAGTSGERENVWARLANPAQPWLGPATIASTYRLAAQYAALVNMPDAMRLAVRACVAYLEAGLPFGLFLAAGLLDDSILRHPAVGPRLLGLLAADTGPASADPVQQTYMLLALAAKPWIRRQFDQPADALLNQLAAHDLHPVGPQSAPLAVYLDLARTMLAYRPPEQEPPFRSREEKQVSGVPSGRTAQAPDDTAESAITEMAGQLAELGRAQANSLRRTMRNQHLWKNAAAPVNIVDLEQVAIYGLATRTSPGWSERLRRRTTNILEPGDALAELPGWAAAEMDRILPEMREEIIGTLRSYFGDETAGHDDL